MRCNQTSACQVHVFLWVILLKIFIGCFNLFVVFNIRFYKHKPSYKWVDRIMLYLHYISMKCTTALWGYWLIHVLTKIMHKGDKLYSLFPPPLMNSGPQTFASLGGWHSDGEGTVLNFRGGGWRELLETKLESHIKGSGPHMQRRADDLQSWSMVTNDNIAGRSRVMPVTCRHH